MKGGIPIKNNTFTNLCRYAAEFTLCSFCGWLYEVLLNLIMYRFYEDRGMLHLPLCPIYGFAGLALLLLFRRHNHWLPVFAGSVLIPTVLELLTFHPLQKIAGYPLWNYSAWWCNFRGIISLPSSLLFGLMGLLLVRGIHPLMDRFAQTAPAWFVQEVGMVCAAAILMDGVGTFLL